MEKRAVNYAAIRVGEERMMRCGMKCRIIAYRWSKDIDVEFEDGIISRHRSYRDFVKGIIGNVNVGRATGAPILAQRAARVGEERHNNQGLLMRIIAYRESDDIDVLFPDDGTVVCKASYQCFKRGSIRNHNAPNSRALVSRLGEERLNNQGLLMRIVEYRGKRDLDVLFPHDGTIVRGRTYSNFTCGMIENPNAPKTRLLSARVGEERYNNQGLLMRIVAYRRSVDMDVLFPDDGTIATGVAYTCFKNGSVLNKNVAWSGTKTERIGESNTNSQGLNMTIIAYRAASDIDVRFDDGVIVEHKSYRSFRTGQIAHPDLRSYRFRLDRVGLRKMNHQGVMMEIVAYRGADDIDVRFDDWCGTVVYHSCFHSFENARIMDPNYRSQCGIGYIGKGKYTVYNARRIFSIWAGMFNRCYDPRCDHYPAYGGRGVYVSDEWHCFQNFAEWYEARCPDAALDLQLDKDLNGGTHYGPDVCVMIPSELNGAVQKRAKRYTDLPTGVFRNKNRFIAELSYKGKTVHLGSFRTPEAAFAAYLRAKASAVEEYALELDDRMLDDGRQAVARYCASMRHMADGLSEN